MIRDQVIEILRAYKKEVAGQYDIRKIGVFGSVARNQAADASDVDVVLAIPEPDLFMLAGIKYDLEERLGRNIDLVTYRETMNPFLKNRIDTEAVYA